MQQKYYLVLALLIFAAFPVDAQCAMCRAVLESEEDGSLAAGVNDGIVYLMLFPYLFIGGVAFFIYRMYRKGKVKEN
jgi:hypothetical protein